MFPLLARSAAVRVDGTPLGPRVACRRLRYQQERINPKPGLEIWQTGAWLGASLAAFALLLAGPERAVMAQQPPAPVCGITTAERVVAVGDVHGAYDAFVAILKAAGILDARERWAGGRAVLVQTGDVLDRGADSRKVMDLLQSNA